MSAERLQASIDGFNKYAKIIEFEASPTSVDKSLPPAASERGVDGGGLRWDAAGAPPPPPANMGVEIKKAKIDWISFTLPAKDGLDLMGVVAQWTAKLGGGVPLDRGRYGYPNARAVLGTGIILWNSERLEMGVHVELTSKSLALYAASVSDNIYTILVDAMGQGATFKRIDICSDNRSLHMNTVIDSAKRDELVTRSRTIQLTQSLRGDGATLYIGAPASDRRVRFYDKAAEQGLDDGSIWTRAEVQLRDDMAHQTVIALLVDDTDLESIITSAVDFRLQDNTNTSRRTRCDWWQFWLGHFSKIKYMVARRISLIGDAADWVAKQVAPTLAYIFEGLGYDFAASWLIYQIGAAQKRIPAYRRSHLAAMGVNP